jgi:hypothetical protein
MVPDPSRPRLPVFLHPSWNLQLSGMRVLLDERGWPRAALLEGPAPDDQNRLALFIASEFEEAQPVPSTKSGVEWMHLAKARFDLERAGRSDLSGLPRFGKDPPDIVLGAQTPVELAQFTHSQRRQVLGLLGSVRKVLVQAMPGRFAHLRNRLVMLGFDDPRGLPPHAADSSAIEAVLDRLARTAPGPEPRPIAATVDPHGYSVNLQNTPLGTETTGCFPLPVLPSSKLGASLGFEIAAALTLVVRARDTESELQRITAIHDRPGNDVLLISAGAPGRTDGFALVADEIAVEPWILNTVTLPRPTHIKRILMHRWSHGDVHELFPSYQELSPSLITGGGPLVIPVGQPPESTWSMPCPCGRSESFKSCHGAWA